MMRWISGLAVLVFALDAYAQDVQARVSRQTVQVGERFQFQVTVRGDAAQEPELPELPDALEAEAQVSHGSSFSVKFVNGRSTMETLNTWTFFLTANRAGTFTIPPIPVRVEGETQYTSPVTISAREAPRGRAQDQRGQLRLQDAVQVEAHVDKEEVYEGEAVELVVALSTLEYPGVHPQNMGSNAYIPPTSEGFYSTSPTKDMRTERRGDFTWRIQEFRQLLYPTRSGELTIGEWAWTGVVYGHVLRGPNRVNIRPSSEPITINVKPLPPSPPGFTGAVGRYRLEASLASSLTLQGVPVELSLKVSGEGNPSLVRMPNLPTLDWAQVASGTSQQGDPAGLRVEKVFQFVLTPHLAGNHEIPAIPFVYFDPDSGEYRTIESQSLILAVTPAEEEGPMVTAGGTVTLRQEGAAPQRTGALRPVLATPQRLAPARSGAVANAVVAFAPPVLAGMLFAFVRRRRHYLENPALLRRRHARAVAEDLIRRGDGDAAERLNRALAGYAADRFGLENAGLTSNDIAEGLMAAGVPEELVDRFVQVVRACERARYANATLAPQEVQALQDGALSAVAALDGLEGAGS